MQPCASGISDKLSFQISDESTAAELPPDNSSLSANAIQSLRRSHIYAKLSVFMRQGLAASAAAVNRHWRGAEIHETSVGHS